MIRVGADGKTLHIRDNHPSDPSAAATPGVELVPEEDREDK